MMIEKIPSHDLSCLFCHTILSNDMPLPSDRMASLTSQHYLYLAIHGWRSRYRIGHPFYKQRCASDDDVFFNPPPYLYKYLWICCYYCRCPWLLCLFSLLLLILMHPLSSSLCNQSAPEGPRYRRGWGEIWMHDPCPFRLWGTYMWEVVI